MRQREISGGSVRGASGRQRCRGFVMIPLAGACALVLAPATGSAWIPPRLAAGSSHSAALRADGTLWAWGDNYNGQIGDGTRLEKPGADVGGCHSTAWSSENRGLLRT